MRYRHEVTCCGVGCVSDRALGMEEAVSDWYRLNEDHTTALVGPIPGKNFWARVDETVIGDVRVSTVFLGLNHRWGPGPPLLFETMLFSEKRDVDWQERCSTWDEALAMHARGCLFAARLTRWRRLWIWLQERLLS